MEADAEAFGLVLEKKAPVHFMVWPECWDVVDLFLRVQTQWRAGPSGVLGLDYGVAMAVADRLPTSAQTLELLDDLQVMEMRARELINAAARAD